MRKYEPFYWVTDLSKTFLSRDYLSPGETAQSRIRDIANFAATYLNKPDFADKFYDYMSRGWYSLATPVWTNFGKPRGMPVSCVTGDTWINTLNSGGKQAKDIQLGDMVLTHKGRYRPVTAIMPTKDRSDIWKLKVATRMTDLHLTGDHLVLTNHGWVRTDELDKTKHLVAINDVIEYPLTTVSQIDLKPYAAYPYIIEDGLIKKSFENKEGTRVRTEKRASDTHVTYYTKPPEYLNIDPELAWALGLWFAEGSLITRSGGNTSGIRITLNDKDETHLADRFSAIMCKYFNLNPSTNVQQVERNGKTNSWMNVNVASSLVGNFFSSFGKGCKNKLVPDFIMSNTLEVRESFLEGILAGDGTVTSSNSISITLANPALVMQLYQLGLSLGKRMSLQMQEKAGKLASTAYVYKCIFLQETTDKHPSAKEGIKFPDGLRYASIKTLERTDKVEDVYDFTVEEDHSFSAAGVVLHNCFNSDVTDDIGGILYAQGEVGMMSKIGGGTSGYFGGLRPRGADITDNGKSTGVVHFLELFQSTTNVISQGSARRGRMAPYLPISHGDIEEFLDIGSDNHPIQDMNSGVVVDNDWMQSMLDGDSAKRTIWGKLLRSRKERGYPYIMFRDNANKAAPEVYKDKGKVINSSNLCVTGDTQILTIDGYKPIESLAGQTVKCWNGSEWSATPIFQTSESQAVLEVVLSNGQTIKATPYHKWYVAKQDKWKKCIGEEVKRTSELLPGDKLVKYSLSPVNHGTKELLHAYSNGFHTADGTTQANNRPRLSLYANKKALLPYFTGYSSYTVDSSNRINVFYEADVLQSKYFVPDTSYSVQSRLEWLAGLFDGDGTLTNNNGTESIQLASVNKKFLNQIHLLLQELGIDSKVVKYADAGYRRLPCNDGTGEYKDFWCQEAYRILIAGSQLQNLLALGYQAYRVMPTLRNQNREATQFVKVVDVIDNNESLPTYCGTEPKHHKLMFNGVISSNCNEIYLSSTEDESFTCILSSMNLLHYDEWKDTDAVETLIYFLDAVATEFISKLEQFRDSPNRDDQLVWEYMKRAHKFTKSQRALGMGVLGYFSYLQSNMISIESREAAKLNYEIFKLLHEQSHAASRKLATEYGEPELLKGYGRRNVTTMAIAPTTSSAFILGQVSQSIEPPFSNCYVKDLAKTKAVIKNKYLEELLESKGHNTREVWDQIIAADGSVLGLPSSILSDEEKSVFLTFGEIPQELIIDQAAIRQEFIDQGQSLNLMIPSTYTAKEINNLHIQAWKMGLKGLYYVHGTNAAQALLRSKNRECLACSS